MHWYDYLSIFVNILALVTFAFSIFSFIRSTKKNKLLEEESNKNKNEASKINANTTETLGLIIEKIVEIESLTKENIKLSLETKLLLQDRLTDENAEIIINDNDYDEFVDNSNMYLDSFETIRRTKNINSKNKIKKKK
ncbi:hypothetical protein [Spiroplasma endosymbiont of Othius punctulatus]|uniref:hypothetical protein n=1 Tax=Spiroplasma endosymbiont of Othius punctulatus TaxID=3066289 RepID=UPI0030CBC7E0